MEIGVISLGCVKNRVDSEQMLYLLKQAGHTLVSDPRRAQAIIINTCGFIDSAKEESIQTILEMAEYKRTGRLQKLIVTGCLSQRYGDALLSDMPEIDALLGVEQYAHIVEALDEAFAGERPDLRARDFRPLECGRVLTTPAYTAYVRVGEGCDNRCAYCAIPLIRGGYRSRDEEEILREMRALSEGGAREQILIAQDTTRYGSDTGSSLKTLLRRAAAIPGIDWLRVLYLYPDEVDEGLLREMAELPNVCRYLDLPLQHASPRVLAAMNRRGDIGRTREMLLCAREMGFTLRTTMMTGFPGETDADFELLMRFVEEIRFDRLGAFTFSAEEGTAAAAMPGQVPEEVKKQRMDTLMERQAQISQENNRARVGSVCCVLVTGSSGKRCLGRSEREAPDADGHISFTTPRPLQEGSFARVRITRAGIYDLHGALEEDEHEPAQ